MKKILSFLVCFSLIASMILPVAFANEIVDTEPPEGIVLKEGERWVPAQRAVTQGPSGANPPDGFTYTGYISGDYIFDAIISDAISGAITLAIPLIALDGITIPAFATYIFDLSTDVLAYYSTPRTQRGEYRDYIYECDDPYAYCGFAYPYINYHYVEYYAYIYNPTTGRNVKCVADSRETFEYALLPR